MKLKFRIWDIRCKHFIKHDTKDAGTFCISLWGDFGYGWDSEGGGGVEWYSDQSNFLIQQFTGLKDKQGREIYEGDILKSCRERTYKIEYFVDGGMVMGRLLQKMQNYWDAMPPEFKFMEIIGNIYENPSLLSGEK